MSHTSHTKMIQYITRMVRVCPVSYIYSSYILMYCRFESQRYGFINCQLWQLRCPLFTYLKFGYKPTILLPTFPMWAPNSQDETGRIHFFLPSEAAAWIRTHISRVAPTRNLLKDALLNELPPLSNNRYCLRPSAKDQGITWVVVVLVVLLHHLVHFLIKRNLNAKNSTKSWIEPRTFSSPVGCSTNWATKTLLQMLFKIVHLKISKTMTQTSRQSWLYFLYWIRKHELQNFSIS